MALKAILWILLLICIIDPVFAEEPEMRLADDLNRLITQPDQEEILSFISQNKVALIADPDLASLAVIALRISGFADVAVALAERAHRNHPSHRRLSFERGVSYWSLGHCDLAKPLFTSLINTEKADDLISRESRLFLQSCASMKTWRYEFSTSVDYDPNLGNTAPRRNITVEPGSHYHSLLQSLSSLIDLPETVTIGEKPVAGIWAGMHPGIVHHRKKPDGIDVYRFGVDARIANREGFEQIQARVNFNRWRKVKRWSSLRRLSFSHGKSQSGQGKSHQVTTGVNGHLRYAFDLSRQFDFSGSLISGYQESNGRQNSSLKFVDQRITFRHRGDSVRITEIGDLQAIGWSLYVNRGKDITNPTGNSGSRLELGLEAGPITLGTEGQFLVTLSHGWKQYKYARPWLRTPHEDKTLTTGVVYTYPLGKDKALKFSATHKDVASADPFDKGEKIMLSIVLTY